MFKFFASLAFLMAAETAPPPLKIIPDSEVPQYLKSNLGELAEWGRASATVGIRPTKISAG
jgi:hypothetical protein